MDTDEDGEDGDCGGGGGGFWVGGVADDVLIQRMTMMTFAVNEQRAADSLCLACQC